MSDQRNVIDFYKYWETDAIKADLDTKRFDYGVLAVNIHGDFNVGTIIRNANAFLAREVLLYGKKQFDRRSTVGTHIYSNLRRVKTVDDFPAVRIIAIDNREGAVPIESFEWPKDEYFLMAFGEEQLGLPEEIINIASDLVYIKQYGSVRSLNVGCASGIAMYDYVRKLHEIC